ncbi:MAG: hypothetical protein UT48_C0009G0008 [Parcubacteria group bacterium GW2011_GWE2_39_37]|uniref:Uncharacterized protein n=1 Tax=Candidatus Falkowbacteria bacterium GW2011_GWF2_39_8 TaxID=1618642 RepID=A0A0G0Q1S2_9BACT|nr:MAG: hypothetical protein UT48_C0009G0008 [Parcubacteria group bacterium GW2011_GWE2_39_37]KKR31306.1 MAG: hypothetical protein UT64_C0065G0004 [Candidatus Falkowbacteria bacterium GW2011_GWF2_39_8]
MSKEKKIYLIGFVATLLFILIFSVFITPKDEKLPKNTKVDLIQLENEYKEKTKLLVDSYLLLLQSDQLDLEKLKQIKDQLLALKVPDEFKDLHVNLVLSIDSVNNAELGGDKNKKIASIELVNKNKENFSWLNR